MLLYFTISLRRRQEEVCQVGVGGVLFQMVGDGALEALCSCHYLLPLLQAAVVGEEGEAAPPQTFHFLGIQSAAATGGQP